MTGKSSINEGLIPNKDQTDKNRMDIIQEEEKEEQKVGGMKLNSLFGPEMTRKPTRTFKPTKREVTRGARNKKRKDDKDNEDEEQPSHPAEGGPSKNYVKESPSPSKKMDKWSSDEDSVEDDLMIDEKKGKSQNKDDDS